MDTMEQKLLPCNGIQPNISSNPTGALVPGTYMSAYHEQDPKINILRNHKNRCFLNKVVQP